MDPLLAAAHARASVGEIMNALADVFGRYRAEDRVRILRQPMTRWASQAARIVLAKVGLDGHDRGIKVVARGSARSRVSRDLRRPLAVARSGRAGGGRRGRRLAGPEPSERGPHDARSASAGFAAPGRAGGCRRAGRRHHSRRRRAQTDTAWRGACVRPGHARSARSPSFFAHMRRSEPRQYPRSIASCQA